MSAYICSPKEIGVLAQRLILHFSKKPSVFTEELPSPSEFAVKLAELNAKSVGYRYRMTAAAAVKDFRGVSKAAFIRQCQEYAESGSVAEIDLSPARLWGIASSYLYQSCEHDGAEQDITYKTVRSYEISLEAECKKLGVARDGWGLHDN